MTDDRLIQEWLIKADEDLAFARVNFEEGKYFYSQICFYFQQAAEKYFKAFIIAQKLEFRKTHDLIALLNQCLAVAPSLVELREDAEYLNAFYIESRYPVHWPSNFSQKETEKGVNAATRIQFMIKSLLDRRQTGL